jgi:hypothetical protein
MLQQENSAKRLILPEFQAGISIRFFTTVEEATAVSALAGD